MNKNLKLQYELDKAKKELEILTWGLSKTNEAIKVLYKDLEQKNKSLQKAKDKLSVFAAYDSLTGLFNRRSFKNALRKRINYTNQNKQLSALLFMDLDNFKLVNDKFGHQIGDSLLREISKKLKRVVKQKDICARFGGDEFAILLIDILDLPAIEQIAKRIVEVIRRPFHIDGNNIYTSVSVGIALLSPDVKDYKTLYSMADMAMYKAKQLGKNRYQLYSEDIALPYKK